MKQTLHCGAGANRRLRFEHCQKAGKRVTAIDINADSIRYAQENGSIACGADKILRRFLREADAVVFALYPHTFVEFVREWQSALKRRADYRCVGRESGRCAARCRRFCARMWNLSRTIRWRGREVSGVQYANAAIFENANFIITPTSTLPARHSRELYQKRLRRF